MLTHADIDAHNELAETPSWGTNQGRLGDDFRPPMTRRDLLDGLKFCAFVYGSLIGAAVLLYKAFF